MWERDPVQSDDRIPGSDVCCVREVAEHKTGRDPWPTILNGSALILALISFSD